MRAFLAPRRLRPTALAALLLVALMLWASPAWAVKVIPPGKEADIAALLAPHSLGEVVQGKLRLRSMQIDRDRIELILGLEDGSRAGTLVLSPRKDDDADASESFSFSFSGDEGARAAADVLAQAVRTHDRGGIYVDFENTSAPPPSVVIVEGTALDDADGREEAVAVAEDDWSKKPRARYLSSVAGLGVLLFGALLGWRTFTRARASWRDEAIAAPASLAALMAAGAYAWICDDAHISMRYAWNLANGHGLVFNLGERVQGYTNPLWTLALALIERAGLGQTLGAVGLGLTCTAVTLALLWFIVRKLPEALGTELCADAGAWRLGAGPTFVVLLALGYGAQPVLAFSTSGLEGSVTHMLVLACLAAALTERVGLLLFLSALALFNRLDTAPLLFPLAAWAAWSSGEDMRARLRRCWPGLAAGVLVFGGWLVFATLYYGYAMPNTWYAKGGAYLGNGAAYLLDFVVRRPSSTLVLLGGPLLLLRWVEHPALRAAAIGCLAQVAYVAYVGGDYMHGRFLSAPLLLACVASLVAGEVAARREPRWRWLAPVLALLTLVDFVRPQSREGVIVIERDPDHTVWSGGLNEIVETPKSVGDELVPELRPGLTISHALIAHVYGGDHRVEWIDGYGLTDPYVARCPTSNDTRAGHFERLVPRAYLRARGDLRMLPDGRARLLAGDPTIWAELELLRAEPGWTSELHRQRFEELTLLTRGPIFAPERLRLIPRYLLSRQELPALPVEETFDMMLP